MEVFLSWSGEQSRRIAEALRDWLPDVMQAVQPWLSSEDVHKGARWAVVLAERLRGVDAAILCLTRQNLSATWLNFEAGALSNLDSTVYVCPYVLDLPPSDLTGPLSQFQCAVANRDDTLKLLTALNTTRNGPKLTTERLQRAFDLHWPALATRLEEIRSMASAAEDIPAGDSSIHRKLDQILFELQTLNGGRNQAAEEEAGAEEQVGRRRKPKTQSRSHRPRVFIASSSEGLQVARALQENLDRDADCTIWTDMAFKPGKSVIETMVDAPLQFDFAIFLLTGDDRLSTRGEEALAPRDNILFELGLFTGALGRARTFMIVPESGRVKLPSDLMGVTALTYEDRRADENLRAALGPACVRISRAMGVAGLAGNGH
jgi:predicted nucleotide-binding protein